MEKLFFTMAAIVLGFLCGFFAAANDLPWAVFTGVFAVVNGFWAVTE